MATVKFPSKPNKWDFLGCALFISECKKYRLYPIQYNATTVHWFAHYKLKKDTWIGLSGVPFLSKLKARLACEHHKANKRKIIKTECGWIRPFLRKKHDDKSSNKRSSKTIPRRNNRSRRD